jgi:hypothetical protein
VSYLWHYKRLLNSDLGYGQRLTALYSCLTRLSQLEGKPRSEIAGQLLEGIAENRQAVRPDDLPQLAARLFHYRNTLLKSRIGDANRNRQAKIDKKNLQRQINETLNAVQDRRIGFFKELPYGRSGESIEEWLLPKNREPSYDRETLLAYLKTGEPRLVAAGVETDVLSKEKKIIGPMRILSDGKWHWPASLVYYLENYNLQLPQEFISYVEAHRRLKEIG